MARGDATVSVGFLDSVMQGVTAAFAANPVYAIIVIVIGFIIGWLLHYQVFGY